MKMPPKLPENERKISRCMKKSKSEVRNYELYLLKMKITCNSKNDARDVF